MDQLIDIEEIAKENHVGIAEVEFDSVDWMCLNWYKWYLILVDSRLSIYKRRWTIAHELWHISDDTVNSRHTRYSERRADWYALDMLIPDIELLDAMQWFWDDCDFYHTLFWVDLETMQKKVHKI